MRNERSSTLRIWDLPPAILCRQHLLGEHRELHGLWRILTEDRRGYAHHPETLRWRGKLAALSLRHDALVTEMHRRGYQHATPLDPQFTTDCDRQDVYVDEPAEQVEILRRKGCGCAVTEARACESAR
jgi:hypothetical protein